ncbi:uncharacterized protein LAJ45_00062 [Morchella importuna]|uniref:uncharacterized protein n=1 Tax=Morchella importuna TaxID=1174673 RepID=UPI001E8CD9FA|nr:uncharacterized protein LAJ45_00062 [Morchella importuna]KAH8155053.1 hypothetical protein LAJ45_00062 [Morchella importuna]
MPGNLVRDDNHLSIDSGLGLLRRVLRIRSSKDARITTAKPVTLEISDQMHGDASFLIASRQGNRTNERESITRILGVHAPG